MLPHLQCTWQPVTFISRLVSIRQLTLRAMCAFQFICKHVDVSVVNTCYISRGMGVTKVSNSKSDLQGHSRSLVGLCVPFDRPHTISCLPLHLWLSYNLSDILSVISPKFKEVTRLWTYIFRGVIYRACASTRQSYRFDKTPTCDRRTERRQHITR